MAHAEGLQPPKDYSVLSPLERKEELIAFYRVLPRPGDTGTTHEDTGEFTMVTGIFNNLRRRGRSDYHKRIMGNLAELLKQCPSTPTFRDYVFSVFWHESTWGVSGRDIHSKVDDNQLVPLLDLDRPESAGIFDPDRVKEMEREVYREHLKHRLVSMTEGMAGASRNHLNTKYNVFGEYSMRLSFWSQQFLDLYGEEP